LINKKKKVDLSVTVCTETTGVLKRTNIKKKIYRRYYKYLLPGRYIIKEILWYGSKRTQLAQLAR